MRTRLLSLVAVAVLAACSTQTSHRPAEDTAEDHVSWDPSEPLQEPVYRVFEGGKVVEKKVVEGRPSDDGKPGAAAEGERASASAAASEPLATAAPGSPPPSPATVAKRDRREVQGGGGADVSVKSGEWDDNANYREFSRWLGSAPATNAMDISNRRFVRVSDADGMPVANCKVSIHADGKDVELVTSSNGRALFFPRAEGMGGGRMRASTSCAGTGEVAFDTNDADGLVELKVDGHRALANDRVVDVVFVLDTTGSMSEEIDALVSTISRVADMLEKEKVTGRFGLIEYKDRTDSFITRTTPMTRDVKKFLERVKAVRASGGGDIPEDVNEGLRTAIEDLKWSESSIARLAFVIGDAPPHLDYQQSVSYAQTARAANHKGIVVHTVAASGMDDAGQSVFRQIAQYTGGSSMFVLRGGAGSASVGGGDPKSSCGGTHANFRSGELHRLITNKVYAALSAVDDKESRIAGLNSDEDAKPCEARVPQVVWQR